MPTPAAGVAGIEAAVTALAGSRLDTMDTGQRLATITAITSIDRQLAGVESELIAGLQRDTTHAELGDGLTSTLARVTRITKPEANRRIRDADDIAPRTAMTGEPLPPRLPATADAVAAAHWIAPTFARSTASSTSARQHPRRRTRPRRRIPR